MSGTSSEAPAVTPPQGGDPPVDIPMTADGIASYVTNQKKLITEELTKEFMKELDALRAQIKDSKDALDNTYKALNNSTSITAKIVADMQEMKDKAKADEEKEPKGTKPLKNLDRKDVDKPDKYSGNIDLWLKWSRGLRSS